MNLEETIVKLSDLGLSTIPQEMVLFTDEPKFPAYVCVPSPKVAKLFDTSEIFGQGLSKTVEHAKVKAIGECVERVCSFYPKGIDFKKLKFEGGGFVNPLLFRSLSETQITDFAKYAENRLQAEYLWMEAFDMLGEKKVFVPGQMVFLSEDFRGEPPLREQITTGIALHSDEETAEISGALEVVERDAYIVAYLMQRELRKINVGDDPELHQLTDYYLRYRLEPHIFDITSDLGIPSVMSIVLDRSGIGPAVNVGLRSDFSYRDAILGSLLESIQCRRMTRLMKGAEYPELPNEHQLDTMKNRYFYWYAPERINDLNFWLSGKSSVPLNEMPDILVDNEDRLKYLKQTLRKKGYSLIKADMTWPEIRSAGFKVIRMIIPELHPLYLNENWKGLYSIHTGNLKERGLKPHPFT